MISINFSIIPEVIGTMFASVTENLIAPQKGFVQPAMAVYAVLDSFVQQAGGLVKRTDANAVQAGGGKVALPEANAFFPVYRPAVKSFAV